MTFRPRRADAALAARQGHLRYLYMRFDKPRRIPSASTPRVSNGMSTRRIALVCMTPASDANEHGDMELPSYGIRRILAALMDDARFRARRLR